MKERNLFPIKELLRKKDPKHLKRKKKGFTRSIRWKTNPQSVEVAKYLPLSYENLMEGQIILGCIHDIRKYDMLVSLPNFLIGKVPITKICNAYTDYLKRMVNTDEAENIEVVALEDLFSRGQHVVVKISAITNVDNEKRVALSLMPQDINSEVPVSLLEVGRVLPCAVAGVEENGYIIDTGVTGVRGAYLPRSSAKGANIKGVGSILQCVVTKTGGNIEERSLHLTLSAEHAAIDNATISSSSPVHLSLLLPGTTVKTVISEVSDSMLKVMLPVQDGVVGSNYLQHPFDLMNQYAEGMDVSATVLYISPISKIVHFTLQDCSSKSSDDDLFHGLEVGQMVEDAVVYKIQNGAYLKLKSKCRAFLPLKKGEKCDIGDVIMCRIIKYAYMDNFLIVSTEQKILEQQILGYDELEAGMKIEGVIKGYSNVGAIVAVSVKIDGVIPFLMLTNTQIKNPELKYPIDSSVCCRVWKVNPEQQHLLLAARGDLVKIDDDEFIVKEYKSEFVGKVSKGCIVSITQSGLLISMFNDVRGFVPNRKAVAKGENPALIYRVGQVVRFRILEVQPEESKMVLTLQIDNKGQNISKERIPINDKVNGVVIKIDDKAVKVRIGESSTDAEIPTHLLTDDFTRYDLVKSLLREGDEIKDAVVFDHVKDKVILTTKVFHNEIAGNTEEKPEIIRGVEYPSVVEQVLPLYNHLKDLQLIKDLMLQRGSTTDRQLAKIEIGQKYCVSVTKITSKDIYVKLRNSEICGVIQEDNIGPYREVDVGQEMLACVINVDYQKKLLQLSSKPHLIKNLHTDEPSLLRVGMKAHCQIVYKHKDYIRVMLTSRMKGLPAYLPSLHAEFNHDHEIRIVISFIEGNSVLVLPNRYKSPDVSLLRDSPCWSLSGKYEQHAEEVAESDGDTQEALKAFYKLIQGNVKEEKKRRMNKKIAELVRKQSKSKMSKSKVQKDSNRGPLHQNVKGKVTKKHKKAVLNRNNVKKTGKQTSKNPKHRR